MKPAHSVACAALLAALVPAQAVTVAASIPTPANVTVTSGSNSSSGLLDTSTISNPLSVIANGQPGVALALSGFSVRGDADRVREVDYSLYSLVGGSAGSCTIDAHEVVIELTAPSLRPVTVSLSASSQTSNGALRPRMDFDLADDGSLESNGTWTIFVGPTPYRIRLFTDLDVAADSGGSALARAVFNMTLAADNDIDIQRVVPGCTDAPLEVFEPFSLDGIRVSRPFSPAPMLAVFGFGAQPVLLSATSATAVFPCLLYPSPDVIVFFPGNVENSLSLPIPDAVRPASLYVQGVEFRGVGDLLTTDGFFVTAN